MAKEMVTDRFKSISIRRLVHMSRPWRLTPTLWRALAGLGLVLVLWAGYVLTGQPITVRIDDHAYRLRVHRLTVDTILRELDLTLEPEDVITPPVGTQLEPNQTVTIELAQPVMLEVDGRILEWLTHQETVAGVLSEAKIVTNSRDKILVNGVPAAMETPLPTARVAAAAVQDVDAASMVLMDRIPQGVARGVVTSARPESVSLEIRRAIPITLNDDGVSSRFFTAQPTVGEALGEQGLTVYEGDKITPGLDTQLSPGMRIYIQRSVPVTVEVDGYIFETRTLRETVGEVLAQEGIALMGQDYSRPALSQPVSTNDNIEVVRVRETFDIEQDLIPFETSWIPDSNLALDRQEIRQPGVTGVIKTRTRIRTENGQEVWREIEDEWLDQEPNDRVIAYGTQISILTLETENGPIEYWRKIPMLATPYNAATSGKAYDHPRYGITRSGLPAGFGVVAVDPKVIPLMTDLYIPDYGRAVAGDTGGLIHGKRIDLGFDGDQPLQEIYEWREVYLLTPVPPADKIRYILPEWPQ